eukprot:scaffold184337_cov27-Tisochrysis_lutea.AAC.1
MARGHLVGRGPGASASALGVPRQRDIGPTTIPGRPALRGGQRVMRRAARVPWPYRFTDSWGVGRGLVGWHLDLVFANRMRTPVIEQLCHLRKALITPRGIRRCPAHGA